MTDAILPPVRRDVRFTDAFLAPRGKYDHLGTDFGPSTRGVPGDPIHSSVAGTLVYRGKSPTYGNFVVVERDNADGTFSYFLNAHLEDDSKLSSKEPIRIVKIGDEVTADDIIGRMGQTGKSAKSKPILVHGHFEQINTDGKLDFSRGWPLEKGNAGVAESGVAWERVGPSFELPNGWIVTSDNGRVSVTLSPEQFGAPSSKATAPSPSFDDRFSAIYPPASSAIRDGRDTGGLPDTAATYDRDVDVGTSPPVRAPNIVGPSIPFVSRPNSSLVAPEGSSLLDPTPMDPGTPGPFSTGGRFVPRASPPQPLYPTGPLVPASSVRMQDRQGALDDRSGNWSSPPADDADRFRSPVLRELQRYRQLAASGVAAAPSSAASSLGIPRAPSGAGSGAGDVMGGVFKWIGNGLIPSAEASPSKLLPQGGAAPDFLGDSDGSIADASEAASPLAKDNRRYLSRRVVGQGSAFDAGAPAVPFVPSNAGLAPDYPNSFEDPFGNRISTGGATQPAQPQQASTPLGLFTGQPMPNRVVPLPIFDILDRSIGRDGSADERESQGTGIPMLDEYIRYLNRESGT